MPRSDSPDRPEYRPSDHLSPPQPDHSWRGTGNEPDPPRRRQPARHPADTEAQGGRGGIPAAPPDPRTRPAPDRTWRTPAPQRPSPPPVPPAADDDFSFPGMAPGYARAVAARNTAPYADAPAAPVYRDDPDDPYTHPAHEVYQTDPYAAPALTIQQRYDILLHTIELYKARWRLAHVRANEESGQLQAYLTPRNAQLSIRQAHQANQLLVIAVDYNGNTEIREPLRRRWWHRLLFWRRGASSRRVLRP